MPADIDEMVEKEWGWSTPGVLSPLCEVHLITAREGGYCSIHQHDRKHNTFVLISGSLNVYVYVWEGDGADYDGSTPRHVHELRVPGDTVDIGPGIVHQFHAITAASAIEVYYPASVTQDDIFRFSLGGHGVE